MELSREDDLPAVDREKGACPTEEDTEEDTVEQQSTDTPERSYVDVLLDFSEQDFLDEHRPHEYHCYSSLEDSVQGWARVAPLSCIHVTEKKCRIPKKKEADSPTPLPADPTHSRAGSPASNAKQSSACQEGNKSLSLNRKKVTFSPMAASGQQSDAPELTAINTMAHLSAGEKEEFTFRPANVQLHHLSSNCSLLDDRASKTQKYSHRPSDTVVPIRNFTFLPAIKSPQLSPDISRSLCRGKDSDGELFEGSGCTLHKTNGRRGSRMETLTISDMHAHSTGLSFRQYGSQFNPQFYSAARGFIPKRHQVPVFSKLEAVHHPRYPMGRSISRTIAQPHMHRRCLFS